MNREEGNKSNIEVGTDVGRKWKEGAEKGSECKRVGTDKIEEKRTNA